jgi:hypothetical protein
MTSVRVIWFFICLDLIGCLGESDAMPHSLLRKPSATQGDNFGFYQLDWRSLPIFLPGTVVTISHVPVF